MAKKVDVLFELNSDRQAAIDKENKISGKSENCTLKSLDYRPEQYLSLNKDDAKNELSVKEGQCTENKLNGIKNSASQREVNNPWETVVGLHPKFYGEIIGKNHQNLLKLQKELKIKLKVHKNTNKLMIKGEKNAKINAMKWFEEFMIKRNGKNNAKRKRTVPKQTQLSQDLQKEQACNEGTNDQNNFKRANERSHHTVDKETYSSLDSDREEIEDKLTDNIDTLVASLVRCNDEDNTTKEENAEEKYLQSSKSTDVRQIPSTSDDKKIQEVNQTINEDIREKTSAKRSTTREICAEQRLLEVIADYQKRKRPTQDSVEGMAIGSAENTVNNLSISEKFSTISIDENKVDKIKNTSLDDTLGSRLQTTEIVDFIPREHFGLIIEKNGATIKWIETQYKVSLQVDERLDKFILKGSEENKNNTKAYLRKLLETNYNVEVFVFGINSETIVHLEHTQECKLPMRCENVELKSFIKLPKKFDNIPKLKKSVLDAFKVAKSHVPDSLCDVMVHCGMAHYEKEPGFYRIKNIIDEHKVVYEPFPPNTLIFEKLSSIPVKNEYIRYDFKIRVGLEVLIIYKLFLKRTEDGNLNFIDCEETDICPNSFSEVRFGQGYLSNPEVKIARLVIIDPYTNITTKVNIRNITPHFHPIVQKHAKKIKESFFEKISICGDGKTDGVEISLPTLPSNYNLIFFRRVERKIYEFPHGNMLRSSKEKVLVDIGMEGRDVDEVYFINSELNNLLQTPESNVMKIADCFEKLLEFSGNMLDVLTQSQ